MIKLDVNSDNKRAHGLHGAIFKLLVVNYEQTKIGFSIFQGLFVTFSKTGPKSRMVANHATIFSYKNCSLCITNYFETSSTVIDTQKYKISHPCVGVYGLW